MIYSQYYSKRQARVPLPIIVGVILVLVIFLNRFTSPGSTPSKASGKVVKNIKIVNPQATEFGIFWQTDTKEIGWVIYGTAENNLNNISLDERDIESNKQAYLNHYVLLKNTKADTVYFYKVVSDNQLVLFSDGKPFTYRTPKGTGQSTHRNPAYGKIVGQNGEPLAQSIVLFSHEKTFPLVTVTKMTGEWLVPLNKLIDNVTMKPFVISDKDKIRINFYSEDNLQSLVEANPSNISPLPQTLIAGKNYTFFNFENVLSAASEKKTTFRTPPIDIIFPKEGALIEEGKPLIKGTAIPGNEITGNITGPKKYSFKSSADKDGSWSVGVPNPFTPGDYILVITTADAFAKDIKVTRKFAIAKSGEQVMGEATAEATPTDTALPSVTVTPTASLPLSLTVTQTLSPTIATTTSTPPQSGFNVIPIGIGSAGLIILGLGILLAF